MSEKQVESIKNRKSRGFITIATGKDDYYSVASNLLHSYRACAEHPLPFAILADRENKYTSDFDEVLLINNPTHSYLDKLNLSDYIPYDETVFIDADSLCLSDPIKVFDDFAEYGDVSYYGHKIPLDSPDGWFDYKKCREYKDLVKFNLCGHGGMYYLRKTKKSKDIFSLAKKISDNYSDYGFPYFDNPADEPVISLAMAIFGSEPSPVSKPQIVFLPAHRTKLKVNCEGQITINKEITKIGVLHFAMVNTKQFVYLWLQELIKNNYYIDNPSLRKKRYSQLKRRMFPLTIKKEIFHFGGQILRRIAPNSMVARLKRKLK